MAMMAGKIRMPNVEIRRNTEARIPTKSRRVGSDFGCELPISRAVGVVAERAFVA